MPSTSVVGAILVAAAAFGAGVFALNRPAAEQPAEPKRVPEFVKPADPPKPDAPKPEPKAEPKPEPKPEPPPPPLVLARWAVPVAVANGKDDRGENSPKTIAVSDDGERVLVGAAHLLDIWRKGNPAPVRAQPKRGERAFVAPDASRGYLIAHDPTRVETYDRDGRAVGSWQPPEPVRGWHARIEFGGFHPTSHKLTVGLNREGAHGFYELNPSTGTGTCVLPLKTNGEVFSCRKLFPQPDGGWLVHYEPDTGSKTEVRGLARRSASGALTRAPQIPDAKSAKEHHFRDIAVSQDGKHVAIIQQRDVTVYDVRTGAALLEWSKQYYFATSCAFAQNRLVVRAASDYEKWHTQGGSVVGVSAPPALLLQIDVSAKKTVSEFVLGDTKFPGAAFALSPDGTKLALANDKEVVVLDATRAFKPR
jgi:hypothetical protein